MSATTGESRQFTKLCAILDKHGRQSEKLITILQEVQHEYGYLPQEVMNYIATALQMSPAQLYGVATFYAHFTLTPRGKHHLKVCDGTACHVRGSIALLDALRDEIGLKENQETCDDLLFTVETVSCLGACGLAPALVVNEDVYGQVSPEQGQEIVQKIKQEEGK